VGGAPQKNPNRASRRPRTLRPSVLGHSMACLSKQKSSALWLLALTRRTVVVNNDYTHRRIRCGKKDRYNRGREAVEIHGAKLPSFIIGRRGWRVRTRWTTLTLPYKGRDGAKRASHPPTRHLYHPPYLARTAKCEDATNLFLTSLDNGEATRGRCATRQPAPSPNIGEGAGV